MDCELCYQQHHYYDCYGHECEAHGYFAFHISQLDWTVHRAHDQLAIKNTLSVTIVVVVVITMHFTPKFTVNDLQRELFTVLISTLFIVSTLVSDLCDCHHSPAPPPLGYGGVSIIQS